MGQFLTKLCRLVFIIQAQSKLFIYIRNSVANKLQQFSFAKNIQNELHKISLLCCLIGVPRGKNYSRTLPNGVNNVRFRSNSILRRLVSTTREPNMVSTSINRMCKGCVWRYGDGTVSIHNYG